MTIPETPLAHVHVHDVMNTGILSTDQGTPLRVVARLMAEQRVHAIAVSDPDDVRRPWGIVSTLGIAAAIADGLEPGADEPTAGEVAAGEPEVVTVRSDESLETAAQIMVQHGLMHLIVVDPSSGHPTGVLSSMDVVAAYGGLSAKV
jgi:CBS domain-containing protein